MKKFKGLAFVLLSLFTTQVFAMDNLFFKQLNFLSEVKTKTGLGWKVGDTLRYNMSIAPFNIKGEMELAVKSETADSFILTQHMDLGAAGVQDVVSTIDKETGRIKKYVVNGQEEPLPAEGSEGETEEIKVVKQVEDTIKVPARAEPFDCIHLVLEDSQGQQTELWINPLEVPINGLIKMTSQQQGFVTVEAELKYLAVGK